jgi:predicted NAD-dependent protein-ADP-ribosyltransferase YbiA (DUF1768 family)
MRRDGVGSESSSQGFRANLIPLNPLRLCVTFAFALLLLPATHAGETDHGPNYPAEWWKPVPREGASSWEILPQDAVPGEVILSKRNELGLLSNFAATPFEYHGKKYASLEGFWQAMKYPEGPDDPRAKAEWKFTREQVAGLSGFDAKHAGDAASANMKKLGITWVSFEGERFEYRPKERDEHYRLIAEATRAKVEQNPEVKRVLLATGNLVLKPDHRQESNPPPAWRYYEILTGIREELKTAPDSHH